MIPKTSEAPQGVVVDIFRYSGKSNMCPVQNLDDLIELYKKKTFPQFHEPVFVLSCGSMLTPRRMNRLLSDLLNPIFPDAKFACHSFRAALPSHMAANSEIFTTEDAMLVGRWGSNAVKRYQRLNGVAQEKLFRKIDSFLQVVIHIEVFSGLYLLKKKDDLFSFN
jgi:hypothetical protein